MKKILLACLLGMGVLAPALEAKSSIAVMSRIVNIHIEGWALSATSDDASGPIQQIQIYDVSTGLMVRSQGCEGYSCSISLSGLRSGTYLAVVITTNKVTKKQFNIG